ncbi:membrane protein FxsA [candidate division KSB1 bacterium]|nr:membrane protein FxsA [candidate division KSB1 bacterium]
MFGKLLLLFVGLPLIELALLIKLGQLWGLWPTIGLVVLTGIVGASLARIQGFLVYTRIQNELAGGRVPAEELIDGLLILVGGVVLLTPGILTDLFGFAMLFHPSRFYFKRWLRKRFDTMAQKGETQLFIRM